jgi:hypothetical protein
MYSAARLPQGWTRSLLYGFVFALAIRAEIDEFARTSGPGFLVRWLLSSLLMGLVLGAIHRALERANRPAR